jgi:DNA invertase Pin-like site-specific DNA recombinase
MVTSFRPKSASIKDDTVLTTVRAVSDLPELYYQYSEYRLEMLEERIRRKLKAMREQKRAHRRFDTIGMKKFIEEHEEFLAKMNQQIIEESKVTKGFTDSSHLLSSDLKERSRKKARTAVAVANEVS